jgi:hypothetical protein
MQYRPRLTGMGPWSDENRAYIDPNSHFKTKYQIIAHLKDLFMLIKNNNAAIGNIDPGWSGLVEVTKTITKWA